MIFLEIAKNDLLQYQETLKNQVDLFFVYHSVDAEVRQLFPVTSNVFYKATIGNNTLHIVYRKNLYTMSHIMLSVSSGHTFTDDQLNEIFEAFLSKNPELKTQQSMIFKGAECVTAQFTTWIKERVKVGGSIKENPCVYYYMNSEQIELTKNHEFNLPDGYSFCDDISQEDALLINSTWKNAKPGDEIQTAARIKYLPFACIKKNSQPVSYVIYDSCGTLNHLYTDANHRQLGLGLAVELRASQKVIQLNRVPSKLIEQFNHTFLSSTNKGKYWTCWRENNNDPINYLVNVCYP
uniref:Glycine N-acyltransferase-like protein n=1 Tax=Rhabditophanes sp. KR3021 TaxID=114890 RepID=A0AC35UHR2_9BILA